MQLKSFNNSTTKNIGFAVTAFALSLGVTAPAQAAGIIFNTGNASTATVALGINDLGHLNVSDPTRAVSTSNGNGGTFGVAGKYPVSSSAASTWQDATTPGCACEGWGVSGTIGATNYSANASVDNGGIRNLTLSSFLTDAAAGTGSFATSKVTLTNLPGLSVTQNYAVSASTSALFENKVTITNTTGSDITNLRYVRDMDWDVPPTEFSELSTIGGVRTTSFLELSHDNGFADTNPLASTSALNAATLNTDFTDNGPADHGAYFKFNFGALAAGDSRSFSIFYGAAPTEADANLALGAAGVELYSFGQSDGNGATGIPQTYIFGFKGVGGVAVLPPPPGSGDPTAVPEPFTIVGTIIGGSAALRMRKKLKSNDKA
jgi:hypothetical protein